MKASEVDPRSIRTRAQLRSALMWLVTAKQFSSLTVKDITDRAGINRSTFYLHYTGVHELLEDCARALFEQLREDVYSKQPLFQHNDAASLTPFVESVFHHLEQHEVFYRAMLGRQGDPLFRSLFQGLLSELIFEPIIARSKTLTPELEMILSFFSEGCAGVAIWWLEKGKPISAKRAAFQIARYILPDYLRLGESRGGYG